MITLPLIFKDNLNKLLPIGCVKIAAAVSGGSDSMALLFLLRDFARKNDIDLTVITVDHGLREESKIETAYVYKTAIDLGLKCFILKWDHKNSFSNLQERARIGRYDLITNLCLELDILVLATAHHKDDFLENYCIRKDRKSRVFGLSSGYINFYNNVMVIRPLWSIYKNELVEFLNTNNIEWFEDQSNYSDKYKRNEIRKLMVLEDKAKLEKELLEVNKEASELQSLLVEAIAESLSINNLGFAILYLDKFTTFPQSIQFQVIGYILTIIGGHTKTPRSESVELIMSLFEIQNKVIKTLHGCIIKKLGERVLFYREFGRQHPISKILSKGVTWDNRFRFNGGVIDNHYISNLSTEDYILIKKELELQNLSKLTINNHKTILFTLPVIKTLEKVVAIPHISYYKNEELIGKLDFSFHPNFVSRFTHFLQ